MKRPIGIRTDTWRLIADYSASKGVPPHDKKHPGRRSLEAGILDQPSLLRDTVVVLSDECEYLIDFKAALALSKGRQQIVLHRLGDAKVKTVPSDELLIAIRDGAVFDQLDIQ